MKKNFNLTTEEAENLCRQGIRISSPMTKRRLTSLVGIKNYNFDDKRCYNLIERIPYDLHNPIKPKIEIFTGNKIMVESCGRQQYTSEFYTKQEADYGGYYFLTVEDSNEVIKYKIEAWNYDSYFQDCKVVSRLHSLFLPNQDLMNNKWFIEDYYQSLNSSDKKSLLTI